MLHIIVYIAMDTVLKRVSNRHEILKCRISKTRGFLFRVSRCRIKPLLSFVPFAGAVGAFVFGFLFSISSTSGIVTDVPCRNVDRVSRRQISDFAPKYRKVALKISGNASKMSGEKTFEDIEKRIKIWKERKKSIELPKKESKHRKNKASRYQISHRNIGEFFLSIEHRVGFVKVYKPLQL